MRAPPQSSVSSHPLALLAASFALGILCARCIALPLIACLIAGSACAALSVYYHAKRQPTLPTLFIALAFSCAGAALALLETSAVGPNRVQRLYDEGVIASGDPVEVTGVLTNQPERAPDGFYLTLRVEKLRSGEAERAASGVVWLFAPVRDNDASRAAYD
ncbi:MAG: DUF4131 domain-containing protein, partial [Pyrinomonadaceae bacterium]|nr:DUF4131 domain-containing protein [Pyrinomonadaceae bacterium]